MSAEMHSVLCMVFNHGKDELITGGTGGMKVNRLLSLMFSVLHIICSNMQFKRPLSDLKPSSQWAFRYSCSCVKAVA